MGSKVTVTLDGVTRMAAWGAVFVFLPMGMWLGGGTIIGEFERDVTQKMWGVLIGLVMVAFAVCVALALSRTENKLRPRGGGRCGTTSSSLPRRRAISPNGIRR